MLTLPAATARTFVAVCLAVSLGVLMLEGLARVFLPVSDPEPVVPPEVRQFDRNLGWSNRPLARAVSHRTGSPVEYRINANGLRDDETPYEKPAGRFRIALVGDSRTFGFGVPIEDHFATLLEARLEGVEVVNLGVGGYGLDQELLMLRREGFRYQPDLVIAYVAHFGAHRHMHSVRFGAAKPRFRLLDGVLELVPLPATAGGDTAGGFGAIVARSRALGVLRRGLRVLSGADGDQATETARNALEAADPRFVDEMFRLGAAIVVAMRDESSAHGAGFLLVTEIPRFRDEASRAGVETLDVGELLADPAFAISEELGHLNAAGNRALADALAAFLQRDERLPGDVSR